MKKIPYKLECGLVVMALPKSCLFCKYCTDIFFDSGGVYLTTCHKNRDIVKGANGKCKLFKQE